MDPEIEEIRDRFEPPSPSLLITNGKIEGNRALILIDDSSLMN